MINSLFDCSTDNIGLHLKNIFKSGELIEDSVTEKIPATAAEGKNYLTKSSTVRIRTFSFLSLIPQRFSVCGRMFWGRFNNCAWLRLAPYFPLLPHLFRKTKTSDFFEANIRTFDVKHPYFCPKKSDVLQLPNTIVLHLPDRYPSPSTKKVFGKSPTFPTPHYLLPCIYWRFRVKDRV